MGNKQSQEEAQQEGNDLVREYNEFKNGKKRLSKAVDTHSTKYMLYSCLSGFYQENQVNLREGEQILLPGGGEACRALSWQGPRGVH